MCLLAACPGHVANRLLAFMWSTPLEETCWCQSVGTMEMMSVDNIKYMQSSIGPKFRDGHSLAALMNNELLMDYE